MKVEPISASRDVLAGAPLLAGVEAATLDEIVRRMRTVHVDAGEVVVRQGDAADRLYVVLSGRLRVLRRDEDGTRTLRELGGGASLGELALLTGEVRSATVEAVRDSVLLELDGATFRALLEQDVAFAIAVARSLAFQLQASGGLRPPASRPAVFSVSSLGPGADPARFAAELATALARFGDVARLTAEEVSGSHASALDRAEQDHAHVVLVDDGEDEAWSAFCARQADRRVVLAGVGAEDASSPVAGVDLVVFDGLPRDRHAQLVEELDPRAQHVVDGSAASIERVARRLAERALGLVLSGGGARGYAHVGAIEALHEAGFEIDRIGGCSMGAFIGGMHALGLETGEMRDLCRDELVRRSPFNDYTLPRVSLIRSRKAGRMLERVFGETILEELPVSLFTVSADLIASRTIVHRRGSLVEAVGASMSIPGLVPPLSRPGRLLVDGGVLNNLPVDVMRAEDDGPIVAVDVIRRLEEMDESALPALPSITETLSRATVLGSVERAESNRRLADLVVMPDVQDVAMREFSALERAADAGRRAMADALDAGGAERLRDRIDARV
jgi:NTE family protein